LRTKRPRHKGFGKYHRHLRFENLKKIEEHLLKFGRSCISDISKGTGLSTATILKQVLSNEEYFKTAIGIRTHYRRPGKVWNHRIRLVWLL